MVILQCCMDDGEVKNVKNQAFQATFNLIPNLP